MHKLASLALIVLHASYTLWALAVSYVRRTCNSAPRPLEYPRRQIPKHLALLLVATDGSLNEEGEETCICRTVVDVVGWCKNCRDRVLERVQQARYARTIPTLHPTFNVFSLGVLYKYAQLNTRYAQIALSPRYGAAGRRMPFRFGHRIPINASAIRPHHFQTAFTE